MVRSIALRCAGGALAGLVAMTGLMAPAQAQTGPPVPLAKAGTLVGWGTPAGFPLGEAPVAAYTLPQNLQGTAFSKVVANTDFTVALTAAGKVVVLGESGASGRISQIPASLATKTVTDIVSGGTWAGAVTSDGGVAVWGASDPEGPDPTDVPGGLSDVAKLAIGGGGSAAAVKANGEVVMWGTTGIVETNMPSNLGAGVKALVAGHEHYYALKADGNVVAWGRNNWRQTTLPESVVSGGNVTDVESGLHTGLALLEDGSLAYWGDQTYNPDFPDMPDIFPPPVPLPAELAGKDVVKISASSQTMFLAVYVEGGENRITIWGNQDLTQNYLAENAPSSLDEADIEGFSWGATYLIALVTDVLEVNKAVAAGSATVGQTLTGTPATFSGSPTAVNSEWLADGVAIAGATGTSLVLTPAHLGKRITFATTATTSGDDAVSTSAELGPVVNPPSNTPTDSPPVTVKPTFKVNKAPTSKKKGKATVTVATRSPKGKATGKATVTIKKGKTTKRIKVTLSGGKKSISLPKLKKGTWKVQVSYNGDKNYKAQKSKTYKLKVKK